MVLPNNIAAHLPPGRLLSEQEWRGLGVQQSRGAQSLVPWVQSDCNMTSVLYAVDAWA